MKTLAAVLVETGKPLELMDLDIPALKDGQVLVDVSCSGVCHTQLLEASGHRGPDAFLPHCLGHEGSGVVREVGPRVTKVKPGQHVVLSWIKGRGLDAPGSLYGWAGAGKVNAGAVTTFQRTGVMAENRLTPIPDRLDMRTAALLGCAVPTGFGAVLNTGAASAGQAVVVFGCGGVGLCAVAAAVAIGCNPVIAVDPLEDKLVAARRIGATHTLGTGDDTLAQLAALTPAGIDLAIEATGIPAVMRQALACVRPRGGAAVVVGNARHGSTLELDPKQFNLGKRLLGTWGGDSVPDRDYPRFATLIAQSGMDLSPFLEARPYSLERVNDALADLEAGRAVRPMIEMGN